MFEICDLLSLVFLLPSIKNMQNAKRFNSKFAFLFFSWNSWLEIWRKILRIVFDNTRSFVLAELKNNKNWKSFLLFFYDLILSLPFLSVAPNDTQMLFSSVRWSRKIIKKCKISSSLQHLFLPSVGRKEKKREEKIILFFFV